MQKRAWSGRCSGHSKREKPFPLGMFTLQLAESKGIIYVFIYLFFCSGAQNFKYMPLAECFLHWEICGSNAPIHLGESFPGMYSEGQAVLESRGRKHFGSCVSAEREHDPEVLQRLVKLLVFVSLFPIRFQVSFKVKWGLCLYSSFFQ